MGPSLRVAGFEDSLSDVAQALYCRPLKSASRARRAPQPGRGRSRKYEAPCEALLTQGPGLFQCGLLFTVQTEKQENQTQQKASRKRQGDGM
jgi:hypothetical protein